MSKRNRRLLLIFLLIILVLALTGCNDPTTDLPECPTPPPTPIPGETPPPPIGDDPIQPPIQEDQPPIITPIPTDPPIIPTPNPTPTPTPQSIPLGFKFTRSPINPGVQLNVGLLDTGRDGEEYGYYKGVQGFGKTSYAATNPVYAGLGGKHNGIDFAAPVGTPVYSNINVDATAKVIVNKIPDANPKVILEFMKEGSKVWIIYGHVDATIEDNTPIQANTQIQLGTLADIDDYRGEDDPHLHLSVTNYGEYWTPTSSDTRVENPTYYNSLLYFEQGVLPTDLFEGQKYDEGTSTSLSHFITP